MARRDISRRSLVHCYKYSYRPALEVEITVSIYNSRYSTQHAFHCCVDHKRAGFRGNRFAANCIGCDLDGCKQGHPCHRLYQTKSTIRQTQVSTYRHMAVVY